MVSGLGFGHPKPDKSAFFRKILNSNLNNFFVLTDRRTFYVDIVNTFPIKKTLRRWGVGCGFYGQPKSEKSIFLFIAKVKYFNHHSFVIYHCISKSLVVLESPLYQLSIWHKD